MVKNGDMMNIEDMLDILAIDLLGVVPDDPAIVISTNRGEPVVDGSQSYAGQAFRNIARRITGEEVPFLDLELQDNFIHRLKKILGFAR